MQNMLAKVLRRIGELHQTLSLAHQLRQVTAWRATHQFICLVNLVQFDPPNNGGTSRIAREVVRVVLEIAADDRTFQPVFLIKADLLDQLQQAFGTDIQTLAFNRYTSGIVLRRLQPNLIISPLFGIEPLAGISNLEHVPHIVSMPDALGLEMADTFPPKIRAARRASYERLKTTTHIVTLSNYSKVQLATQLQIDPQKLVVIAPGAEAVPLTADTEIEFPWHEQPYVYYPANLWAHKRHDLLLQTMLEVWQERPDLRLVLTGSQAADFGIDFANLCRQYNIPAERVRHLGYVDDAQVGALYSRAYALLFVSNYEGFGLPLVEAMHSGCPVICAPVTAIPEIAGDAALYVASSDAKDWADALLHQLPAQREALIQAGYLQAQRWSWQRAHEQWRKLITSQTLYSSGEAADAMSRAKAASKANDVKTTI